MRGISEVRLKQIAHETHDSDDTNLPVLSLLDLLISECQELNTWMTLDEFLKSGFVGACWVYTDTEFVYTAYYAKDSQFYESDLTEYTAYYAKDSQFYESDLTEYILDRNTIVRVAPIHKPEPPR